jgi:hypothetical protein
LYRGAVGAQTLVGNALLLFDSTGPSGTILAVIDTTAQVQTLLYEHTFDTALTAALANGTAADLTITFL